MQAGPIQCIKAGRKLLNLRLSLNGNFKMYSASIISILSWHKSWDCPPRIRRNDDLSWRGSCFVWNWPIHSDIHLSSKTSFSSVRVEAGKTIQFERLQGKPRWLSKDLLTALLETKRNDFGIPLTKTKLSLKPAIELACQSHLAQISCNQCSEFNLQKSIYFSCGTVDRCEWEACPLRDIKFKFEFPIDISPWIKENFGSSLSLCLSAHDERTIYRYECISESCSKCQSNSSRAVHWKIARWPAAAELHLPVQLDDMILSSWSSWRELSQGQSAFEVSNECSVETWRR